MYDPRKDWHFEVIKAFHQSLIDDRYSPVDTRRFVKEMLPGVMSELERLKGETKRLEAEIERLQSAKVGLTRTNEGEDPSASSG
jgi:hypothetical protein